MRKVYESWNQEQQEMFISYCTGMRGIKLLYDTFFKELFNPDTTPERLEEQKQENEIQKCEIERLNAIIKSFGH